MDESFQVGGRYRNRKGPYEVVSITDGHMTIRYDSGELFQTTVERQQRIIRNMRDDEAADLTANLSLEVSPTFLTKEVDYEPTAPPSPLLSQLELEELSRVRQFWELGQVHWDVDSRRLTASDGSFVELSRPLLDGDETQEGDLHSLVQSATGTALNSANPGLIAWAMLYAGYAVFSHRVSPPVHLYMEAMQRIAEYLLQTPMVLSDCISLTVRERREAKELPLHIADEFTSLYLRACLLAGKGCFISHISAGKTVLGYLDPLDLGRLRTMAHHSAWVLSLQVPTYALNLLSPDHNVGEKWVSAEYLHSQQDRADALREHREIPWQQLNELTSSCWREIRKDRRYGIPSQGRAEVLIDDTVLSTLGLTSVRFVQEGVKAPGVYLRLQFGEDARQIGIVKVSSSGRVEGFHELEQGLLMAAVRGVALAYYRDLVTPGDEIVYEPTGIPRKRSGGASVRRSPRELPRPRRVRIDLEEYVIVREFDEWYYAQERARHSVVGHIRWVGSGFMADEEKYEQALKAGVYLPDGCTWVVEHDRGGSGSDRLRLRRADLTSRTLFSAPARASDDIAQLLS